MVEVREFFRRNAVACLLALLFGYILLRGVFQARRLLAPGPRASGGASRSRTVAIDEVAPEDLSRWLADLPESEAEHDPDAPPGRPPA